MSRGKLKLVAKSPLLGGEHAQQVLGDCVQALEQVATVKAEGLRPEHFEQRPLRILWDELVRQQAAGLKNCDLYAIQAALREHGAMDAFNAAVAISRLQYVPADSSNAAWHAKRLIEQQTREQASQAASTLSGALLVHDDEAASRARDSLVEAQATLAAIGKPKVTPKDLAHRIVDRAQHPEAKRGLPTGLARLDEHLGGGFSPGWLVVILASAKAGKSALAINNFARHTLRNRGRVLVVSQEMTADEIVERWLAAESSIAVRDIQTGNITTQWDRLFAAEEEVAHWPAVIEGPVEGVEDVCALAEREHREHGLDLLVVENLQLFDNGRENRVDDLSITTRKLKLLAARLKVPVVLCSQPTNDAAKHKDGDLGFFDGKGSGSIAADCDVMLVPRRGQGSDSWKAGLSIVGGRNVAPVRWELGTLRFDGRRMCFEETLFGGAAP